AGVLADRPRPPRVHVAVDPAGIRKRPRVAEIAAVLQVDVVRRGETALVLPAGRTHVDRPSPSRSAPTSTTILPTCWFSFIIWCGAGHSENGKTLESTGSILPSAISWFARSHS